MKISSASSFLDLAPAAAGPAAPGGEGAKDGDFDAAVRKVAGESGKTPARKAGKEGLDRRVGADGAVPETAIDEAAPGAETSVKDAANDLATADVLGRLLAGAGAGAPGPLQPAEARDATVSHDTAKAAVAAPPRKTPDALSADDDGAASATFDGALEERLVITPIGAASTEAGTGAAGAAARGGVGLEVLHMETHFEPRADDFVLVEGAGKSDAAAAPASSASPSDALEGVLSTIRAQAPGARDAEETAVLAAAALRAKAEEPDATGRTAPVRMAAAADPKSDDDDEGAAVPMRFDEALARLSAKEQGAALRLGGQETRQASADAAATLRPVPAVPEKRGEDGRVAQGRGRLESPVAPAAGPETLSPPQPVAIAPMTGQIAGRVIDAFRADGAGGRAADLPPGDTHIRLTAGGAALKTLTIQLQPENLGTLEVSMRLVDGKLTLELAASQHETAVALGQDRAGLKKLLEHAGFSMDEASITIVTRDATAAMTKAGAAGGEGGQPSQGRPGEGEAGSGASSGERGSARDRDGPGRDRSPGGGGGNEGAETPVRRRSSVFL